MKKLDDYIVRLKKRSQLPILHKMLPNGVYIACELKTNGTWEVYCNPNGSQKSGGGTWSDTPVDQRLSIFKGKSRDKYLNKKSFKTYPEAREELLYIEEEASKVEYL